MANKDKSDKDKEQKSINDILQLAMLAALADDYVNAGKLLKVVAVGIYKQKLLAFVASQKPKEVKTGKKV